MCIALHNCFILLNRDYCHINESRYQYGFHHDKLMCCKFHLFVKYLVFMAYNTITVTMPRYKNVELRCIKRHVKTDVDNWENTINHAEDNGKTRTDKECEIVLRNMLVQTYSLMHQIIIWKVFIRLTQAKLCVWFFFYLMKCQTHILHSREFPVVMSRV